MEQNVAVAGDAKEKNAIKPEKAKKESAGGTSIVKDALILMVITLVAAVLLGLVNELTKGRIAELKEQAKQDAYKVVYAEALSVNTDINAEVNAELKKAIDNQESILSAAGISNITIDEAATAVGADGNVLGYCILITNSKGYGGKITLALGISLEGEIKGIAFTTLAESPGLGMRADETWFKDQFKGIKSDSVVYTKDGTGAASTEDNVIDSISGATISTRAVTNSVNAGITFVSKIGE